MENLGLRHCASGIGQVGLTNPILMSHFGNKYRAGRTLTRFPLSDGDQAGLNSIAIHAGRVGFGPSS